MVPEPAKRISKMGEIDDQSVCYWKEDGCWWIYLPRVGCGRMPKHTIEEHEDGTITVTPSVLLEAGTERKRHGYLTRGVWNEC
jgi:hypothetical protein